MSFRIKSLLVFALIFTILASLAILLFDRSLIENLGPQGHILGLALIGCVLLVLSGYVWDRNTAADLKKLKNQIATTTPSGAETAEPEAQRVDFSVDGQNEVLGIARQIEQMAQALQKVDARYRAIVEDQTDLVCRYLPDGKLTFINNAYCQALNQSKEEILGQRFFPFEPGEKHDVHELITRLSPEAPIATFEHELTTDDGRTRWHQWTNRAIFDNYGRLFEHQAVGRDVTETRSLEAQVRQSQKLDSIGQLAAGIAHDYNNILTVIQGHASLLAMGNRTQDMVKKSAEQICIATDHASNLSRQLLVFSSKEIMHIQPMDLNDTLRHLTKMLGRILSEDITLELNCADRLPPIEADRGMVEQIVFNLAVNARDAMPNGGNLTIETAIEVVGRRADLRHPDAYPGRFVRLSVHDSGCGIAPENLQKIFEPFFTTKGVGEGTGLGLATVYGIVKQHHGWIDVKSKPDAGTRFSVFLPAVEIKPNALDSKPKPAEESRGTETILLAEDETVLRELIKGILEDLGYTVLDSESGLAALKVWREHRERIDLLLTDLVMPDGVNGRELAQTLTDENPDLKIIYISGYSADIVGKDLLLQQGYNFLQKPFEPNALAQVIRMRLDERPKNENRKKLPQSSGVALL